MEDMSMTGSNNNRSLKCPQRRHMHLFGFFLAIDLCECRNKYHQRFCINFKVLLQNCPWEFLLFIEICAGVASVSQFL